MNKPTCLIISSKGLSHSACLGKDLKKILTELGYETDFLTMYEEAHNYPGMISLYRNPNSISKKFKALIRRLYRFPFLFKLKKYLDNFLQKEGYYKEEAIKICYENESNPKVPVSDVINKINKHYDFIITLFWDPLLNSTSLKKIYDKVVCPILVFGVDMAPMTGGCYYFSNCEGYKKQCGKCPALKSLDENDQSHKNFILKKENYNSIDLYWLGNTYMNYHMRLSGLLQPERIFNVSLYFDELRFKTLDRVKIRKKMGFSDNDFIILTQSSYAIRKGSLDVHNALLKLYRLSSSKDKKRIKIITIGDDYLEKMLSVKKISIKNLGIISIARLIDIYNVADVFICGSIDDAGPSMVNQSILCGTPVVAYNSGTAIDVIHNGISGYKTPKGDINGLYESLQKVLSLPENELIELRKNTRVTALKYNSIETGKEKFKEILSSIPNIKVQNQDN